MEEAERKTERKRLKERDGTLESFGSVQVVKRTVGIEHLSISITQINGLTTT